MSEKTNISAPKSDVVLLNDSPLGLDDSSPISFNHHLYADLLRDILLTNRPGTCVGLLARWGQGKSTVINLLKKSLTGKAQVVVFNAYQARGDSVRRQLLLSILRQIAPDTANQFERFNQTVTGLDFATAEEKKRFSARGLVMLLMKEKKFDPILAGAAVSAILLFGVLILRASQVILGKAQFSQSGDIVGWAWGSLVACVTFIARKLQQRREHIIAYTQPVSDSQRLKYPEQFAKVFTNAVRDYCSTESKRLVIVIDDLDRCDPSTVVEALASVRQFCHGNNGAPLDCQFLIPCDESQMISALEADGYHRTTSYSHYHNYSETEMLRKFFDVVVRMDEIVPESLADFAADQGRKIGISETLARDIVDAAALQEPRKVKSLLNALRVAQEAVARNQASGLLPPTDHLDRLDYTLALLVCLQELAPKAFATLKENTEILAQTEPPKEFEPIVRRIIAGLSPISITTADVLITKQNEPSLHQLPKAHAFTAAVRNDAVEEVLKILTEVDEPQRNCFLNWIGRKLRDARSSARIRQLLAYVLDFGAANGWECLALRNSLLILNKQSPYLADALRLGSRMEKWIQYCKTLKPHERLRFDEVILANYLEAPSTHLHEEKYVLHFVGEMPETKKQAVRDSIESTLFVGNGVNSTRLKQLSECLPQNEDLASGLAPAMGDRLFRLLGAGGNPIGIALHSQCLQVGLRLVGSNESYSQNILAKTLIPFFSHPQHISEEFTRENRVYFDLLRGLLRANRDFTPFSKFFQDYYINWLNQRNGPRARLLLIQSIQPAWGCLSSQQIDQIAEISSNWVWTDEDIAKAFISAVDEPSFHQDKWVKGRNAVRQSVFNEVCKLARNDEIVSTAGKEFFLSAEKADWRFPDVVEALLADKCRRLNSNSGRSPNNINEWLKTLRPLCGSSLTIVAKALRDGLSNNSAPAAIVNVAVRTVWIEKIPSDCTTPLADALLRNPDSVNTATEPWETVLKLKGFDEVCRILLKHIQSKGAEWIYDHLDLMTLISRVSTNDAHLSSSFQNVIELLLTSNREDQFIAGIKLLEKHSSIHPDVRRSLESWRNGVHGGHPHLTTVDEIIKRPVI